MVLDAIVAIALLWGFFRGYSKGLVMAVLSLLGVLLASIVALKLGHVVSQYIAAQGYVSGNFSLLIAFAIIFIGIMLLVRLLIKAVEGLLKLGMLGWANKLAGGILYAGLNVFVCAMLLWLGTRAGLLLQPALADTVLVKHLVAIAPLLVQKLSTALPFLRAVVQQLTTALR